VVTYFIDLVEEESVQKVMLLARMDDDFLVHQLLSVHHCILASFQAFDAAEKGVFFILFSTYKTIGVTHLINQSTASLPTKHFRYSRKCHLRSFCGTPVSGSFMAKATAVKLSLLNFGRGFEGSGLSAV